MTQVDLRELTHAVNLICRQLGYELGAEEVINGQGSNPSDPIALFELECDGEERHITDCSFQDHASRRHSCSGTEKAGVRCRKTSRTCERDQFHCADRECIHINNLCDGINHCRYVILKYYTLRPRPVMGEILSTRIWGVPPAGRPLL